MTYREKMIEAIKIACNDLIEHAEDIVPRSEGLYDIDFTLHIPSVEKEEDSVPSFRMTVESYISVKATTDYFNRLVFPELGGR